MVRYRKAKIQECGREVQRVEKTLQDAGIKLSSVASEVLGVSARRMLDALISGTHDPDVLAELAKGTLRKKIPALREALEGRFSGHHALLIGQMLAQMIDFLDETIATLSGRIEALTCNPCAVTGRICSSRCRIGVLTDARGDDDRRRRTES